MDDYTELVAIRSLNKFTDEEMAQMSAFMLAYTKKAQDLGVKDRLCLRLELPYGVGVFNIDEVDISDRDVSKFTFDPLSGKSMDEVKAMLEDYLSQLESKHRAKASKVFKLIERLDLTLPTPYK